MKLEVIRQQFLEYFAGLGHRVVPGGSLVPLGDDTLLFTNAGMVQFKDAFLGADRGFKRAVSAQRCVRAGGKHNDLENVGYTARHHTFFEMLGNFSFGDYFKKDAIVFAWTFLTQTLKIPAEKLWVTVYQEDIEAEAIWLQEIGVSPERLSRCGEQSNFWSMGDTGPCGPCTEIFYDHGSHIWGGPPGSPEEDGDRYVEIWNLVFMQYNRHADGHLEPLPKPSVDTGMGLERISAVMQGVHNNYEIDLFQALIGALVQILGGVEQQGSALQSLRVMVDHIRSTAFLIADGVQPSNEGRGYVLRRIIRRAIRHGHKLGATTAFFYRLVEPLVGQMGQAYPFLVQAQADIQRVLKQEEEQFARTLDKGLHWLEEAVAACASSELPGSVVFKLYDTYGFPVDLTADIARERGFSVDREGFERAMEAQRTRARKSKSFEGQEQIVCEGDTVFLGYEQDEHFSRVTHLYADPAHQDRQVVVLEQTPFYAEAGGQIGDQGLLYRGETPVFKVLDTQKSGNATLHYGHYLGDPFQVGERVHAVVNLKLRSGIKAHHSATHLLHAALRQCLGDQVVQQGSRVSEQRLRFDFRHGSALSKADVLKIERLVNQEIIDNTPVVTRLMDSEEAIASGAMALFGEKYGAQVRVLCMGTGQEDRPYFSVELCGGTHVRATGEIGFFKIVSESGIAAGIRRIEAVVGLAALEWVNATVETLTEKAETEHHQAQEKQKAFEKQMGFLSRKVAEEANKNLAERAIVLEGCCVLAEEVVFGDAALLRSMMETLKGQLKNAVIVLGCREADRVNLLVGVQGKILERVSAPDLVNFVAAQVDGKGGGRRELAQAGGNRPDKLADSLESVVHWVASKLKD